MEDSKIVALYWQRSQQAISETAKKYSAYCYKIAFNILCNTQDSDECVNDTYLKAWNCIPPTRPNILSVFLAKITRNISLDRYKKYHAAKRGAGQVDLALSELEECICCTQGIDEDLNKAFLTEILNSFLKSLPSENRNIFIKRYWYIMSISDIAKEYDVSESKIKSTLFKLRGSLKSVLESKGVTV